jgi:hypothetical protein
MGPDATLISGPIGGLTHDNSTCNAKEKVGELRTLKVNVTERYVN